MKVLVSLRGSAATVAIYLALHNQRIELSRLFILVLSGKYLFCHSLIYGITMIMAQGKPVC
jgi:hypothetical protein